MTWQRHCSQIKSEQIAVHGTNVSRKTMQNHTQKQHDHVNAHQRKTMKTTRSRQCTAARSNAHAAQSNATHSNASQRSSTQSNATQRNETQSHSQQPRHQAAEQPRIPATPRPSDEELTPATPATTLWGRLSVLNIAGQVSVGHRAGPSWLSQQADSARG